MTSLLQSFGLCRQLAHSQTLIKQAGSAAEIIGASSYQETFRLADTLQANSFIVKQNSKIMVAAQRLRTALREACWSYKSGKRQQSRRIVLGKRQAVHLKC